MEVEKRFVDDKDCQGCRTKETSSQRTRRTAIYAQITRVGPVDSFHMKGQP